MIVVLRGLSLAQLTVTRNALPLSLAVAGSHGALEMIAQILPVTYPLLVAERGFTYSQIGTLALVATVCTTLTQPIFGWIADRTDPKRLTVVSIIWVAAFMSLIGLANGYWSLVAFAGCAMLGSAAYHPSAASLVSRFGRKGAAMSYFATGGAAGAALAPLLIAALLTTFGLRGTLGLLPVGLVLAAVIGYGLRTMPAAVKTKSTATSAQSGSMLAVALIVLMTGARAWVEAGLASYLPEWQVQQGATLTSAGSVLSLFLISFAVGGFASGFLSERFGKWQVVMVTLCMLPCFFWVFINTTSIVALVALVGVGISAGTSNPLAVLMAQEAWPSGVGMASSLAIGIGYLPAGIGAWTVGQLADRYSLDFALSTLTFVPLIAIACAIGYRVVINKHQRVGH